MRYSLLFVIVIFVFSACKKDKFTAEPQIKYKSVKPDVAQSNINCTFQAIPVLTIHLTDAEGDLGFITGKDTSYVYVKNLITNRLDSAYMPDLQAVAGKNFSVDVDIDLCKFLGASTRPRPKTDTLYFEVYVKDFAKNKSNIIRTEDPVYYISP